MNLTVEQVRRTEQALEETERHIAKELGYQEKFQNKDRLTVLNAHKAKLEAMLQEAR